jgi:hypothetical protein
LWWTVARGGFDDYHTNGQCKKNIIFSFPSVTKTPLQHRHWQGCHCPRKETAWSDAF